MEIWKSPKDFSKYEVSTEGKLRRNNETKKLLSTKTIIRGYIHNTLTSDSGNKRPRALHVLVAKTFLPNPDDKPNVIHKDHNKLNNHVENLEWGTVKEQCGHKKKHELEQLQMADSRVVYEIDTRTGKLVIWKSPKNFLMYEVSDTTGKIRNKMTKKMLSIKSCNGGYIRVCVYNDNGKRKTRALHRLVAIAFLPNLNNKPTVNHKDHNKVNNNVENLEWATVTEQNRHKRKCKPERQQLVSSRVVWRLDKLTGEKLQRYETITLAAKWIFDNKLTSIKNFNRGNNIKTRICAVCRKRIETRKGDKNAYMRKTAYGFKWEYDISKETKYENELWKPIPPNLVKGVTGYQISDMGRVKNHKGRITEGHHKPNNYRWVNIHPKQYTLHILMAQVFLPNIYNKPIVNHKDGDKTNAKLYNLEWCTYSENMIHAHDTGLLNWRIPVIQYDPQMNELNRFGSLIEASKCLSVDLRGISKCCSGKANTAGGFIFRRHDPQATNFS